MGKDALDERMERAKAAMQTAIETERDRSRQEIREPQTLEELMPNTVLSVIAEKESSRGVTDKKTSRS